MSARSEIIGLLDDVAALGQRNYGDRAPEGTTFPYTVTKPRSVGRTPMLAAEGHALAWRDQGQIDLWQHRTLEDPALLDTVCAALDGVKLIAGLRLRVRGAVRVPDENQDLVHDAITVSLVSPV